ncbi:MAG: hypothetical protein WDZ93_00540 [Candidatus Paceibacterota bacterium]
MPQDNDVPYNAYSVDFFGSLGRWLFGSGDSGGGARDAVGETGAFLSTVLEWVFTIWGILTVLSLLLCVLLLYGIIYTYLRAGQLDAAQEDFIATAEKSYRDLNGSRTANWRWDEITGRINSNSPNDWKLAIIDADVMLYETLESAGFVGTSIGEMLKSASPKHFTTLDTAWNAHKIRNQIAHSGTDFVLTKKVAQETITQYRMVFEEFGVV